MKKATLTDAAFSRMFGIDMADSGIFDDVPSHGFGLSFGRVQPGESSAEHRHDESESFVIIEGKGEVLVDGAAVPIAAGDVIGFDPFERHVIRNTGGEALIFADLYWRDPARAATSAVAMAADGKADDPGRPIFVFSTPPTPNGDLHLGHLSGPYLGADVYVRFQRMLGSDAYHLTGSDDYQSYVCGRARQEGKTESAVAAYYAAEIRSTLELMDIGVDQYTVTSTDPGYADGVRDYFSRIVASGRVVFADEPALIDGATGDYLYEVDVGGACPGCGSACGGNICEECGEPNRCVDLVDPGSKLSDASPEIRPLGRHVLPLHEFRDEVERHLRMSKAAPRLEALAARVLEDEPFHLPITHPQAWGIQPREAEGSGQVVWVWPEMAYGFLHGIEALGRRIGRPWQAERPEDRWKIIHFFGYDNSFYHSILYPVLYRLAYPEWTPDIDYNLNEFYLLDGQKFSTSRRHAIWGKEILNPESVDAVRFYLSLTRGEIERANFELAAFSDCVNEVLIGRWQAWLQDLGRRVEQVFHGRAPDAGDWTAGHRSHLARLEWRRQAIAMALGAEGFSLNQAARELDGLVVDALRFERSQRLLATTDPDRYRTAIALELASASLLAAGAAAVMPRFAARLSASLGRDLPTDWPDTITLIAPGSPIGLADRTFFTPIGPALGATAIDTAAE